MLEVSWCRRRQQRLLGRLQERKLNAAVIAQSHLVYYFTGHRPHWLQQAGFALLADGSSCLITANQPARDVAADETTCYEAQRLATQCSDQASMVGERLAGFLARRERGRIGFDASSVSSQVLLRLEVDGESIDGETFDLRRVKDPDELTLMRVAIRCSAAMYERARQIIEPGIPELTVYSALHAAAVEAAGEPMSALLGNDFACGVGGGAPRGGHSAKPGQIYILDVGPAYRGYFADNARSLAVGRDPSEAQQKAWAGITGVFPLIERLARPGTRCRELFSAASEHLRQHVGTELVHHLGHGVGLEPHEAPHLNPRWDDVLREGEVFTAEPGVYGPELAGGIRIENQYLVTRDGVENLTPFPLDLV